MLAAIPKPQEGQVLVEPLPLLGITRYIKFLRKAAQERRGGLTIHISGFNCGRLKVVIVKVIIFSAFCSLSFCCCSACLAGAVFVVAPTKQAKSVHNCCIPYHTRLWPLYQAPKVNPSGLLSSPIKPTGSKAQGRLMQVNDLGVDGWMSGEAACALSAGEPMQPPSSSTLIWTI